MKKFIAFLIIVGLIALAYFTFPVWVALAKIVIGLIFLTLFIAGIVVGRLIPKKKR